jgi:hypothetical protein
VSRVLLFVQDGDGRPKCVGRPREWFPALLLPRYQDLRTPKERVEDFERSGWTIPANGAQYRCTARQKLKRLMADRWWLVECLDAKHGRAVLAGSRSLDSPALGRILASGGKP